MPLPTIRHAPGPLSDFVSEAVSALLACSNEGLTRGLTHMWAMWLCGGTRQPPPAPSAALSVGRDWEGAPPPPLVRTMSNLRSSSPTL